MKFDNRYNPVVLKLELLSQGIKPSPEVRELIGKMYKEPLRQRAGVGSSGIDLVLAKEVLVGVPTDELFCAESPFTLEMVDGEFGVVKKGKLLQKAIIYPRPRYYDAFTSGGVPMRRIGTIQGDFVGIATDNRCWFWGHYEGEEMTEYRGKQCRFCSIGLNLNTSEQPRKSIDQILEVVGEALKEKHCRHVSMNAGTYPPPGRGHEENAEIIRAIKETHNCFVRLSIAPPEEEKYVDILVESGADLIGYDYEVYDPELYRKACPGKYEEIDRGVPHAHYDRIMKHAVQVARPNVICSNLLAGLEPRESTIAGVEHLASMGVVPRIFVFRPLLGTAYERHPVSSATDLIWMYPRLKEILRRYGVDAGCSGCSRVEVGTKIYQGINPVMPDITEADLEYAGIDPVVLR